MKLPRQTAGFTLVEVLVSGGIIVVIMGVLLSMTDQTQRLMKTTSAKVEQFQEARVAFESMTRRLAQATLNTFWDYKYDTKGLPSSYQRSADLRFISGPTSDLISSKTKTRPGHSVFFHAPNGFVDNQVNFGALDHLINACGYFVEIGDDQASIPQFLKGQIAARQRFRLMELMQPSEQLQTYQFQQSYPDPNGKKWFDQFITGSPRPVRVLAENIVALIILPRLSKSDEQLWMNQHGGPKSPPPILAPNYSYDSTTIATSDPILNPHNQLPPVVQVAMVAIDEPSAMKLEDKFFGTDPNLGLNYSTMFRNPAVLEDDPATSAPNDGDLSKLETLLISKRAAYRIFSTSVSIRGAKWSRNQAN